MVSASSATAFILSCELILVGGTIKMQILLSGRMLPGCMHNLQPGFIYHNMVFESCRSWAHRWSLTAAVHAKCWKVCAMQDACMVPPMPGGEGNLAADEDAVSAAGTGTSDI